MRERKNGNVELFRDCIHTGTEYVSNKEVVNVRPSKKILIKMWHNNTCKQ